PVFGVHANESGGTPCVRLVMIEIVDPSQICHGVNGAITGTTGTCTTSDTVTLVVHPIPVIAPFTPWQICEGSTISIITNLTQGVPPLSFAWTPNTGLIGPNTQNPTATPPTPITYCVTATDSIGCSSNPECVSITFHAPPTISPAVSVVCASDQNPQNTFTLDNASAGSTISWATSPNYGLIVSSPIDSSFITVNFPQNITGSYSFTAIVEDFTTGCIDTVSTNFSVTNPNNVAISGPSTVCEGTTVNLSASGAANYSWSSNPAIAFANPQQSNQSVSLNTTTEFYVTGTTGTCSQTDTIVVTVNTAPDIQVTPPLPSCGCDTLILVGSTSTGAPSFTWTAGNGTPIINPNAPATIGYGCNGDAFTLTVTDLLTGCSSDSIVTAVGRPSPNVNASVSPVLICPNTATQITLDGTGTDTAGNTISWTADNASAAINDSTALNTSATVYGFTVFTLTVSDAFGCDSSTTDTVFVQPQPLTSANTPFLCTSDAVLQSTISVTGASPNSTFNWATIPGCVTPTNPSGSTGTFDFSGCGPGIYTFNLIISDPLTGCTSDLTETVNVINGVTLSLDTDTVTICEGANAQVVVSGANTYQWSNGATSDTVQFTGLTASGSPYPFTVTGTVGSCSSSSTVVVRVNPVNQFGPIQGPIIACSNDSTIRYFVGAPGNNYVWSVSGGQILSGQGTDTISVSWGLGLSGVVTLTDTSTTGCPGPPQNLQIAISQSPAVLPLVTGNREVCDSTLEVYTVFGANPGSTFTWAVGNGQIVGSNTGSSITVQWPDSGSGTVTVYETNAAGCTGPLRLEYININDIPVIPVITGQQQVCQGNSGYYALTLNQGSGYVWTVNGGTVVSYSTDNDTVFVSWPNSVPSSVSVIETNSFGCSSDPAILPVTVSPQPSVDVLGDSIAACQNTVVNLSSISPFGILNWTTSGSGTFSDTTVNSPNYSVGSVDIGLVNLVLTANTPGCNPASDSIQIYLQAVPQILASAASDTICYASSDTIFVNGAGSYTYVWSNPPVNDSVLVVSPLTTTTYSVIAYSSFGCTSSSAVTVSVIPPGTPDAGADVIACLGDVVQLTGNQLNATGLLWTTTGDGAFTPADTSASAVYSPGINDTTDRSNWIFLTTTGACYNLTDSLLITYTGIPIVYAGPDTLLTTGFTSNNSIVLQPNVTNVAGVIWSTTGSGYFEPSDTSLNASYVPSADDFSLDSIVITLTSIGSCQTASDEFVIEISPFIIPNVFTPFPASPGKNDFFVIKGLPEESRLRVYDRWGVLVFESTDYRNNWDAANLEAETFYYVLNSRGREFHGWIQVMRDE
ncbi:MAG: gliding motility-associated C-terminal domain-containing protein, partial [Bacteroidota bacterium]